MCCVIEIPGQCDTAIRFNDWYFNQHETGYQAMSTSSQNNYEDSSVYEETPKQWFSPDKYESTANSEEYDNNLSVYYPDDTLVTNPYGPAAGFSYFPKEQSAVQEYNGGYYQMQEEANNLDLPENYGTDSLPKESRLHYRAQDQSREDPNNYVHQRRGKLNENYQPLLSKPVPYSKSVAYGDSYHIPTKPQAFTAPHTQTVHAPVQHGQAQYHVPFPEEYGKTYTRTNLSPKGQMRPFPAPHGPGNMPASQSPGVFHATHGPGVFPTPHGPGVFPTPHGPGVFPAPNVPGVFPVQHGPMVSFPVPQEPMEGFTSQQGSMDPYLFQGPMEHFSAPDETVKHIPHPQGRVEPFVNPQFIQTVPGSLYDAGPVQQVHPVPDESTGYHPESQARYRPGQKRRGAPYHPIHGMKEHQWSKGILNSYCNVLHPNITKVC